MILNRRQRILPWHLFLILLIFSGILSKYFVVFFRNIHCDDVQLVIYFNEIVKNHNFCLKNVYTSNDTFLFTQFPYLLVIGSLFGITAASVKLVTFLTYMSSVLLFFIITYKIFGKNVAFLSLLFFVSCSQFATIFTIIPYHNSIMVTSLLCTLCLIHLFTMDNACNRDRYVKLKEMLLYSVFFIVSALSIFSDLLYIFIYILPLLFIMVLLKMLKVQFAEDKKTIAVTILAVCSVFAGLFLQKIASLCGLHLTTLSTSFATFPKFLNNTLLLITLVMKIFNAHFIEGGHSITNVIIGLLNFFLLFLSLYWTIRVYMSEHAPLKKFIILYFLVISVFIILAFLFSVQAEDLTSARYLVPLPYTFALSFSLLISDEKIKLKKALQSIILMLFIISFVFNIYESFSLKVHQSHMELARYLEQEKLTYGYAPYWHSNIVSLLTENRVRVRSVMIKDGLVKPCLHNSNADWYEPSYYKGPTFLMVPKTGSIRDETGIVNLKHAYLNLLFGEYEKVLSFENMDIYVWPYNIMNAEYKYSYGIQMLRMDFHEIGSMESTSEYKYLYSRKGEKGYLFLTPALSLEMGKYRVKFETMGSAEGKAGRIEIFSPGYTPDSNLRLIAVKDICPSDTSKWDMHSIDFAAEKSGEYIFGLNATGLQELKLRGVCLFKLLQ